MITKLFIFVDLLHSLKIHIFANVFDFFNVKISIKNAIALNFDISVCSYHAIQNSKTVKNTWQIFGF